MEFLTVNEVAKILKVSSLKIYKMIWDDQIKAVKLGKNKRSPWRIPQTELQRLHAQAYVKDTEE